MAVSDVRSHRKRNCLETEVARCSRTTHPTTVLEARMGSDRLRFRRGAPWVGSSNLVREGLGILCVCTLASNGSTAASPEPLLLVVQALLLSLLKSSSLHKEALAFVTLACTAEAHDYRRQTRVLPTAATERSIARGQVDEMIKVRTAKA
jgi:hypothetical protein